MWGGWDVLTYVSLKDRDRDFALAGSFNKYLQQPELAQVEDRIQDSNHVLCRGDRDTTTPASFLPSRAYNSRKL